MTQETNCPLCGSPASVLVGEVEDYFFSSPGRWDYRRCEGVACGISFPDPMPSAATLMAAYTTYYTHGDEKGRSNSLLRPLGRLAVPLRRPSRARNKGLPVLGWISEQVGWETGDLDPVAGGTIVDVGAGDGCRLALLAAEGWGQVIGIEPDAAAVAVGRAAGLNLREGAAEALPLPDASADAVILHHVIEHVADPRRSLDELHRVLRPGGRMFIITPNIDSANRVRWGKHWRGFEAPRHLAIFSVAALVGLVGRAGFEVELARSSGRSAAWMSDVSGTAAGVASARIDSAILRLLASDRAYRAQQREIAAGHEVGDEIALIARKLTGG